LDEYGVRHEVLPADMFKSAPGDAFDGRTHRRMGTVQFYANPETPGATAA
jgi:hypothetical protein